MSDLRTRIAKALYRQIVQPCPDFDDQPEVVQTAWLEDADAVIAELQLRQEWLTEESSRLGLAALTKPEHPIATRTSSPWIAEANTGPE